jgi:multiple sugar transport system substrate-binding protein
MRQWNTVVNTNLPARQSVQSAAEQNGAFDDGAMATFANAIAEGGRAEPRYTPEVYQAISDAIQAAQLDGADAADAASEASGAIEDFLGTYDGAPII